MKERGAPTERAEVLRTGDARLLAAELPAEVAGPLSSGTVSVVSELDFAYPTGLDVPLYLARVLSHSAPVVPHLNDKRRRSTRICSCR